MENVIVELLLGTPWVKELLVMAGVWATTGLVLAGVAHTFTTGVLRPLSKLSKTKWDDMWVARITWWTDAVSDILREVALGKWVAGYRRVQRMWNDRRLPLAQRRWE